MRSTPSSTPAHGSRRVAPKLILGGLATVLLTTGCSGRTVYENAFSLGFPHPITEQGQRVYDLWLGSAAAATVVGVLVWGLIFVAIVRFRKSSDELPRQIRYNLPIEVLYTVVPFVIMGVLFFYTARDETYLDKLSAHPDVTVNVVGFKWNWQFGYANEKVQVTGATNKPAELVLPTDRSIRFVETSPDVIHSFWVPAFLFKRDVVPGRANQFEIKIHTTGTFTGHCAELCGEKHSQMNFVVRVVSGPEFDAYISKLQADPAFALNQTPMSDGTASVPASGSAK